MREGKPAAVALACNYEPKDNPARLAEQLVDEVMK